VPERSSKPDNLPDEPNEETPRCSSCDKMTRWTVDWNNKHVQVSCDCGMERTRWEDIEDYDRTIRLCKLTQKWERFLKAHKIWSDY
jgi:hypothetical protein